MKLTLSLRAILSLIFLLALLIGDAFVAYSTTSQLRENTANVSHTHEVMDTLSRIHSNMAEAQTGQRGYIITALQLTWNLIKRRQPRFKGNCNVWVR